MDIDVHECCGLTRKYPLNFSQVYFVVGIQRTRKPKIWLEIVYQTQKKAGKEGCRKKLQVSNLPNCMFIATGSRNVCSTLTMTHVPRDYYGECAGECAREHTQ